MAAQTLWLNGIGYTNMFFSYVDDVNDYTLIPPIMDTFEASANPPDGATICLDIDIIDDDDYEADHDFTVAIQLSVTSTLAMAGSNALVTIQDNGGK